MRESQAVEFMAEVQRLCFKYGAYCSVLTQSKPTLEHVKIEITAKVITKKLDITT